MRRLAVEARVSVGDARRKQPRVSSRLGGCVSGRGGGCKDARSRPGTGTGYASRATHNYEREREREDARHHARRPEQL